MATKTAERPATQTAPKEAPRDNLPAQAPQKQKPPIVQFREYVEARMATLEDALPPTITPKRFVSVVMTALQNKPKLLECTFPSLWNACVRAAQDGLLPDGREGAIAPYGENKDGKRTAEIATWMPMIEGYRKKIFETGKVKAWEVNVVREKDEFEYELGDNAFIRHKPYMGLGAPGGIVGAYSIAKLLSGETVREVMSAFEINQIAAKSKASTGPWKDAAFVGEMSKKVVARRHYKQLPHTESMDAMIAREDADHGLADPEATPIARPARRIASREAFDAYAGAVDGAGHVIYHDDTTGEVADADFRNDDQFQTAKTEVTASAASGQSGEAAGKEAGAATKGMTTSAPASTAADQPIAAQSGASKEADDAGAATGASVSNPSSDFDDDQVDGADRPWPPGTKPTNDAEYERYLDTRLALMTKPSDWQAFVKWWGTDEQAALRQACKVTRIKELQNKAVAYKKDHLEKAAD